MSNHEDNLVEVLGAQNGVNGRSHHAWESEEPPTEPKVAASGVTAQNLFRHPDVHPIALDMLLLRQYGPEWMLWEGETIQHVVEIDFAGQVLSDLNLAKAQACRTLHLVDTYWQRWEVFGWCTAAFNSEFPDFEMLQVPTVAQVLVSMDIATRIRDDMHHADEIKGYVSAVFRHDGIFVPIAPADWITVDPPAIHLDVERVKTRWPDVRAAGKMPEGESIEDEQLRRMLIAHEFLEASRERLQHQLGIVGHA